MLLSLQNQWSVNSQWSVTCHSDMFYSPPFSVPEWAEQRSSSRLLEGYVCTEGNECIRNGHNMMDYEHWICNMNCKRVHFSK